MEMFLEYFKLFKPIYRIYFAFIVLIGLACRYYISYINASSIVGGK
jgi:hypothetical protein